MNKNKQPAGKDMSATATSASLSAQTTFNPEKGLWIDLAFLNTQVETQPTITDDLINKDPLEWSKDEQIRIAQLYIDAARDPKALLLNRWFDAKSYLRIRPDVAQSDVNPSLHFFSCGYKEEATMANAEHYPSEKVLRKRAIIDTSKQSFSPSAIHKEWTHGAQKLPDISSAAKLAELISLQIPATSAIVISLSHDNAYVNTGGIQKIIREETESCSKNGIAYILISPTNPIPFPLETLSDSATNGATALVSINGKALGTIMQSAISILARNLDTKERKTYLILHHFFGFGLKSISTCISHYSRIQRAFWWIHDYSTSCISYTLLFNRTLSCGSPLPESNQCDLCEYGIHRHNYLMSLAETTRIKGLQFVYPSQAALEWSRRGHRAIPDYAIERVLPHGRLSIKSIKEKTVKLPERKIIIGYIGAPERHKGWDEFYALANDHRLTENFEFIQIGTSPATQNIKFALGDGRTKTSSVETVLRENHVDYAFIWPLWPETFCFVAYEAAAASCHILTHNGSGNIARDIPCEITTTFDDIDSVLSFFLSHKQRGFANITYADGAIFIGSNYSTSLVSSQEGDEK